MNTRIRSRIENARKELTPDLLSRYSLTVEEAYEFADPYGLVNTDNLNRMYEYGLARGIRAARAEARRKRLSQKKGESSC